MTPMTDDELGVLLNETFTAHEHLADPDRARALTSAADAPRPRRAPVLLAAAASVALITAGSAYLVFQGGAIAPGTSGGPVVHAPPPPPIRVPHVTHAQAVASATKTIARVAAFPGATETDAAGVPELNGPTMTSSPRGYTVSRSRWWTVPGVTPKAVAQWYADHPTRGFVSDGGLGAMTGTGDPTIEFASFHQRGAPDEIVTSVGVRIVLETTTTAAGVGIRARVDSVWSPSRAAASYARDVSSIDVRLTTSHFGQHVHTSRHHWTITDAAQVAEVARVFNGLQGSPPFVINCPAIVKSVEYRVVFHSSHGHLVAMVNDGSCGASVQVTHDGTLLPPALADPTPLVKALTSTR